MRPSRWRSTPRHRRGVASVGLIGNGTDASSIHALDSSATHRAGCIRRLGSRASTVTGTTALSVDFDAAAPCPAVVFAFVLALAFLLLLFAFRSLIVPLLAIGLNLLSVAAAYGVLVLVFQHSWASHCSASLERRDRELAAALPLRAPVRAVDGLPRLHPQPHQGTPIADCPTRTRSGRACGRRRASSRVRQRSWWRCSPSLPRSRRCRHQTGGCRPRRGGTGRRDDRAHVPAAGVRWLLGERNWYLPRWLHWLPRVDHSDP